MKPDLICIVGKNASGKDTAANYIAQKIKRKSIAVSDILKEHCKKNNILPSRDNLIHLGNTIFDGETCAKHIYHNLGNEGILTGIRKQETLKSINQYYSNILIIGCECCDSLRYSRAQFRAKLGDVLTYPEFIEKEAIQNTPPSKENIDFILKQSDFMINNDQNEEFLFKQIDKALASCNLG